MLNPQRVEGLQESLRFRPRWHFDPVPWWFFERLDEKVLADLARVQLQFQADALTAELKAVQAAQKAIGALSGR